MTVILAYVDPGLGALLWQSIIAAFIGFLFYLNKTRRWIVGAIRKVFGHGPKTETIAPKVAATPEVLAPKIETKTEGR